MKIRFLGHGGAFATSEEGNTNACITLKGKNLLIDFGICSHIVWREHWKKTYSDITALWLSHLHCDHVSLEPMFFYRYFHPTLDRHGNKTKPIIFADPSVLTEVWAHLEPSMRCYRNEILHLTNFAECHGCSSFTFEGVKFTSVKNPHITSAFGSKFAFGLKWEYKGVKFYWSSDSATINQKLLQWADVVFHDCETSHFRSGVHAHYLDLRKLPDELRKKIWLMHYSPHKLDAAKDGFAGFITKDQEFLYE